MRRSPEETDELELGPILQQHNVTKRVLLQITEHMANGRKSLLEIGFIGEKLWCVLA